MRMDDADDTRDLALRCRDFQNRFGRLREEVAGVVRGQEEVVEQVLVCLVAGGHALIEGLPGLGKTLLARTLGQALGLSVSRVQCTPDLMPADITGTAVLELDEKGAKRFQFEKGPVFAQIVLADEINRATPKTQSALLEAMQEGQVTVGGVSHPLPRPFLLLATQNPIEMEGTYPLPEAQIDRFLFKITIGMPPVESIVEILGRTSRRPGSLGSPVGSSEELGAMTLLARETPVAREILDRVSRLLMSTHPASRAATVAKSHLRYGLSVRAGECLVRAAQVHALLAGRHHVAWTDIEWSATPALRHRLGLSLDAEMAGISPDALIAQLLQEVGT